MVPVLNTLSLAVVAVLVFAAHAAHHDSYATAATVEDDLASRAAALSASRQLLGGQPISIDSSVVLLFMTDVEGGENSPCVRMVKRSLEFKGRALNFFVTGYYADHNGDNRVEELGYKESQWDKSFRPYTMEAVSRFSRGLAYCMRRAVDNDLYIVTHIHLDDGLQGDTWRNSIIFNPSVKYGSMTYWDAIAKPTAEAVRKANYRKREVYFAMQAEMGATLFYHPVAWRNMIDWVKNVISKDGTPPIKVKVGININWNKVCGCPQELAHSSNYFQELKRNWPKVEGTINITNVRGLFRAVDFIGVSAYAGIPRTPSIADLETSLHKVDQELSLFGMSLKGLGKELIFSEYGIGGGMKGDYSTPAPNSAIVAASPYWGVGGMYSASNDPWRVSDNRRFLQQYYRLTTEYARRGGVAYPISALFLWNIISYDVQGIHYMSSSSEGSYRDSTVVNMITTHNRGLRRTE